MTATLGAHPPRIDLVVHAGEPVDFTVPVLDDAGVAVPSLSGWTAAAQIRTAPDSPTVLATLTAAVVGVTVRVTAPVADTAGWTWNTARWDLVLTSPTAVPHVLCAGWVRIYPTITH